MKVVLLAGGFGSRISEESQFNPYDLNPYDREAFRLADD